MGRIGDDVDKLGTLATDAQKFADNAQKAYDDITSSITNIEGSWEGDDGAAAVNDLTNIKKSIKRIVENANSARDLLKSVSTQFSEIHYESE